jgi:hypothetical protein
MIYTWQEPYISALLETENSELYGRILEVRAAFEQRLLSYVSDEELRAMGVAAAALDALERKCPKIAKRISDIRSGKIHAPATWIFRFILSLQKRDPGRFLYPLHILTEQSAKASFHRGRSNRSAHTYLRDRTGCTDGESWPELGAFSERTSSQHPLKVSLRRYTPHDNFCNSAPTSRR